MVKKYFSSIIPNEDKVANDDSDFKNNVLNEVEAVKKYMNDLDLTKAVTSVFNIFTYANTYIQKVQPWVVAKEEGGEARLKTIMKYLLEAIRIGSELLYSFMPEASTKVLNAFGLDARAEFSNLDNFNGLEVSSILGELGILFPRLDVNAEIEKLQSFVK